MGENHGAQTRLMRSLSLWSVAFLAASWMSPAAGVFIIAPEILQGVGTGTLLAFVFGTIFTAFVVALDLEALSIWPSCGGMYVFIAKSLNQRIGLAYLFYYVILSLFVVSVLASGIGPYLRPFLPNMSDTMIAQLTIALAFGFSLLNLRINEWATSSFLLLELLLLLLLFAVGAAHFEPSHAPRLLHSYIPSANGWQIASWAAFLYIALGPVGWITSGTQTAATVFSEEMKNPRHFVRAAFISMLIIVLVQLLPILAVLMSDYDVTALLKSKAPFTDFMIHYMDPRWALVIDAGVALATFNAMIVSFLFAMRVIFSTARNGVWPEKLSQFLSQRSQRTDCLWGAAVVVFLCCFCLNFLPTSSLMLIISAFMATLTVAIPIGCWQARRNGHRGMFRVPFFPIFVVIFYIWNATLLWSIWNNPHGGPLLFLLPVGLFIFSQLYHHLYLRHRPQFHIEGAPD